MSETVLFESPLARFDLAVRAAKPMAGAGIVATEHAFLGHLNLRGDPGDPRFVPAISSALGVAPPVTANTVVETGSATIYWLGPDEWLIVTSGDRVTDLKHKLRDALATIRQSVTDVSGGQTVVVLRGAPVRELLAKGCPLDLHPRAFAIGQCAQSHLAKAPILLRPILDGSAFELVFRRSFADYIWTWLEDAAAEWGLAAR